MFEKRLYDGFYTYLVQISVLST